MNNRNWLEENHWQHQWLFTGASPVYIPKQRIDFFSSLPFGAERVWSVNSRFYYLLDQLILVWFAIH